MISHHITCIPPHDTFFIPCNACSATRCNFSIRAFLRLEIGFLGETDVFLEDFFPLAVVDVVVVVVDDDGMVDEVDVDVA